MTSATVRGDKAAGYSESRGLGLVFFAAMMLLVVALYGLCAYGGRAIMSDA